MNNYSNTTNRKNITENFAQNTYAKASSNQTVNRTMPLMNSDDYYYDQQTNIKFITRPNQQNLIPAPISTNLLPLDSLNLTPCRRTRAQ